MDLESFIIDVPDFPEPGIVFKDLTPLLGDPGALAAAVEGLVGLIDEPVDVVAGVEARGFLLGTPLALRLGTGFVPVRKPGKLPRETRSARYELEYGTDALEIHADAVDEGARVLVVDDVLATGGTMAAACDLVTAAGARNVTALVLIELAALGGRSALGARRCESLLRYP